ncbi:hypothetical protein BC835DRAFT_1408443 [Cytidiella melzeri]|nr:hypothetical protein BC835DRAFT_1408443 [Cytidiella melzeri]
MRSLWARIAVSLVLPWVTLAIKSSEVGVVDWHRSNIGYTLTGNPSLLPVFHRVEEDGNTKSLVLAATASNVLAALHPENGTIAWRYLFDDEDRILAFKKHGHLVATMSGTGGAALRLFDVSSGHLLLELQLHRPEAGRLLEPEIIGLSLAFDSDASNVYALTNGHTVRRVDTKTGEVQWGWSAPDQTSLNIYTTVLPTSSAVYVIGLSKSFASYTLHIMALSPSDGTVLATVDVPSKIGDGPESILFAKRLGRGNEVARVAWLEGGKIQSVGLTPELKEKPATVKGAAYEKLIDTGLSEHGMFVAIKDDGAGRVIKLNEDGTGLKVIWEYKDSVKADHYTGSMYSGGIDKDGHPYVARVFWSHVFRQASAHVFAPHLAEGKGLVTGYTFPFKTSQHGIIGHVAVDAATLQDYQVVARIVVSTSTGGLQLWQQDQLQWSREEGLVDIRAAEFVELPERQVIASGINQEAETFLERLQRQITEARDFPQYIAHFVNRFVTGSYESVSGPIVPISKTNDTIALVRDAFGFRKIIIAATSRGKVYGIDSSSGEIIWSRVFGLGWAAEVGGQIFPVKVFTTRTVGDGDSPQVVLVTQRKASNTLVDTVLFHIDALTGEDATNTSKPGDVLQGIDVIAGPLVDAFFFQDSATKYVVLFDEFLQTYIYPDTPENLQSFAKHVPSLHFALRTGKAGETRLTGHRISSVKEFTGRYVAYASWTASLPAGEDIHTVVRPKRGPVASYGKVLGNRTTLYKYLNPNLVAVTTSSLKDAVPSCGVYVIDSAKGTTLYHAVLPAAHGTCDVKVVLAENWLVYHYYDDDSGVDQAKGYRMVSVEFYEGSRIDEKIRSSDLSSYSNESTSVNVYEQAYVFPRAVSAMATTSTTYGITSKDIIVAGENGNIQSFARRFVDPRRPKRKTTAEEQEEWLVQYEPLTPDDPKRVLSHTYKIARTREILTSPALLESTSLVFAYGLDLFATRIAPSNTFDVLSEDFNKVQLVLTVTGLALAILVTKPMVRQKKLRERWYN